jgi:long-chain acyl-CoA synthetase
MAPYTNLYELLREKARTHGSSILFDAEERKITYAEALASVEAIAAGLAFRGVRKGDRFAIALRNCPEFVLVYLALARIGAAAVPINFLVTKPEELKYLLEDSGACGVVTQKEFFKGYHAVQPDVPKVRLWLGLDEAPLGGELLSKLLSENRRLDTASFAGPDDLACLLYTSGTTGVPKGAMLTHANMLSNARSAVAAVGIVERDSVLALLPFFHTFAWMVCAVAPIMVGARVVLAGGITPAGPWLKAMGRKGVTIFPAVPQIFSVLAREAKGFKRAYLRYWSFRRVRFGVSGAAPLSRETLELFENRLGVPILEGYGLTETSPAVSINTLEHRRAGTVGRPIPGVSLRLLDEKENDVAEGEEGEVCVRGENVMKGYWNRPEATQEAFTADGEWLKTGDIGRIDSDGYLKICDRKKDMIIIKGLKVFPAQVEAVLLGHPSVAEAAVVGIPEPQTQDELIKAFVVLKDGASAEKSELLKFMRERLDPYKRPRDIEIMKALPKNALQKVLKRELRRMELARLESRATEPAAE